MTLRQIFEAVTVVSQENCHSDSILQQATGLYTEPSVHVLTSKSAVDLSRSIPIANGARSANCSPELIIVIVESEIPIVKIASGDRDNRRQIGRDLETVVTGQDLTKH
jgi:hypothetical protein